MKKKFTLKITRWEGIYTWDLYLGGYMVATAPRYYTRRLNALRAFKTLKARLRICEDYYVENE